MDAVALYYQLHDPNPPSGHSTHWTSTTTLNLSSDTSLNWDGGEFEILIPISYQWADYDLSGTVTLQSLQTYSEVLPNLNLHIENGDLKDSDGNIFVFDFNENPKLSNFQNHIVLDEDETTSVPLMISDVEIRGWGSGGMINPTSDSVSLEILNNENWITYNQSNSTIIFTPSNNEVGEHDFTLKLTDKDGNFSEENLSITVNNVNDAPVLEAISDSSTDEDADLVIS